MEVVVPEIHCAHDKVVPISELKPNPRNPNTHPQTQIELLSKIIKFSGWRNPIVVSNRSGYIIKGHARLAASFVLKLTEVPVDFQDYASEEAELEDMLADNRIAELADLDKKVTADLLTALQSAGRDLDITGFGADAVAKMFEEREEKEKPEVPFTEELLEEHNYVVLYFDNSIDWTQLLTLYPLPSVQSLDSKPGFQKQGIGRVIKGVDFINALLKQR